MILHFQLGYGNITLDCPSCLCNATGSTSEICNPHSGQCQCKEGVTGRQCDECEDTYFDLTEEGCEGKCYEFVLPKEKLDRSYT